MDGIDVKLPSGANLHITLSDYRTVRDLQVAIFDCARRSQIPLTADLADMDVSKLAGPVLGILADRAVEEAVFACLERTTYNGLKVTPALMDDPLIQDDIRADFYMLAWEVIKANCAPFFAAIFSKFKERLKTPPAIPK